MTEEERNATILRIIEKIKRLEKIRKEKQGVTPAPISKEDSR